MNATENQSNSRHQRGERPKNMSKTSTKPAKALLIEEIRQLGQTLGVNTVFTTFLEITATCLSAETDPSTAKDRKARYQELIEGMEPETVNAYARMCALLYLAVRENWDEPRDILGAVYHELNLNNAWNGQYFTPDDVCRMMAMLTLGEDKLDSANQELLTINEPACGSGAMVIGAVWAMKKSGTDYRQKSLFYAQDIDIRCVWMAHIQLVLYEIPAVVVHGNTLTLEEWSRWYTPNAIACLLKEGRQQKEASSA